MNVVTFAALDPFAYQEVVRRALAQDIRWGDVTTDGLVSTEQRVVGNLVLRTRCVLAGLDVAAECFRQLDPNVRLDRVEREGTWCDEGTPVARVAGSAAAALTAERTALTFLRRLSGVATLTRRLGDAASGRVTVRDTGETTPTLRALEQYAVRVGGGLTHGVGLDDRVVITQNHAGVAGGVGIAVARLRRTGTQLPVEVVICAVDDIDPAIAAGAAVLRVDAAAGDLVREAVRRSRGHARVAVSGALPHERVAQALAAGADYASLDLSTDAVPRVEVSLELTRATN